jgi:SagB-type dehydrogenase family enzyme
MARRLRRVRRERKHSDETGVAAEMPREILDRIERVRDYHNSSKHTYASVRTSPHKLDWPNRPSPFRVFDNHPKVDLPRELLSADAPAVSVLSEGLSGLPEGAKHPPHDLTTLASWLHLANGITGEHRVGKQTVHLRSCPSTSALFPFEIYVAAFAIAGLEPGLYHYSVKECALRKLRDGGVALAQIKKGRPDLDFLKTVPAVLLVSTVFCRSTWRFRQRGYRYALIDAGHLVQNLVTAANGLGIQTTTRLTMNHRNARELIGVAAHAPFGEAESVQAMVVWAETATQPMTMPEKSPLPKRGERLQPIPRPALAPSATAYGTVVAVHHDCVAPGVAVREIRPPLTESNPFDPELTAEELPAPGAHTGGPPLAQVMTTRRSAADFVREPINLDALWTINRLAFRGGSHFPVFPSGPHVGLLRPMWIVNAVDGMQPGLWCFDAACDRWMLHRAGEFRLESRYLCLEQPICGHAAAACFMLADLKTLMDCGGPDTYRLAHLEAGVVGQRMFLAAAALGVGCAGIGPFYDDETIAFLEPKQPGWEAIYSVVLGVAKSGNPTPPPQP